MISLFRKDFVQKDIESYFDFLLKLGFRKRTQSVVWEKYLHYKRDSISIDFVWGANDKYYLENAVKPEISMSENDKIFYGYDEPLIKEIINSFHNLKELNEDKQRYWIWNTWKRREYLEFMRINIVQKYYAIIFSNY